MFARVLVAIDSRSGRRDALVLGSQLVDARGTLVVADLLPTTSTPLAGDTAGAARRRDQLRDGGDEVYATLGPDPRVHYLPVSGLPLVDAVVAIARRERAEAIVVGERVGRGPDRHLLIEHAPCAVVIAPYGHRFAREFLPERDLLVVRAHAGGDPLRHATSPVVVVGPAATALSAAAARR